MLVDSCSSQSDMCTRVYWDFVKTLQGPSNKASIEVQHGESGLRPKQLSLNTEEDSDGSLAWMML